METPAIVNLLAVIGKVVIALMLAAGGWAGWIAVQNWHAISV